MEVATKVFSLRLNPPVHHGPALVVVEGLHLLVPFFFRIVAEPEKGTPQAAEFRLRKVHRPAKIESIWRQVAANIISPAPKRSPPAHI